MIPVQLKKCSRISGHRLDLRDAAVSDAEFILSLRIDELKSRFLSKTVPDLVKQQDWLRAYQSSQGQAYFILESRGGEKIGTVRMYDGNGDSFCWGSWLIVQGAPSSTAIESALIVYQYGLLLGFRAAHFDVRKGNKSVWQFHEKFGATKVGETDKDFIYSIDEAAIRKSLDRYRKYLPMSIQLNS